MDKLVSEQIESRLNQHIKWEKESAEIYDAMATWCRFYGYNNVAEFFFKHGEEERSHAKLIINFMDEKECMAIIPQLDKPSIENFKSMKSVFNEAYKHELFVTNTYKELAGMSLKEADHDTYGLAIQFLKEQREEISVFSTIIDKLDLLGDGAQAAYLFDESFE